MRGTHVRSPKFYHKRTGHRNDWTDQPFFSDPDSQTDPTSLAEALPVSPFILWTTVQVAVHIDNARNTCAVTEIPVSLRLGPGPGARSTSMSSMLCRPLRIPRGRLCRCVDVRRLWATVQVAVHIDNARNTCAVTEIPLSLRLGRPQKALAQDLQACHLCCADLCESLGEDYVAA
jgi:hypothetical protein